MTKAQQTTQFKLLGKAVNKLIQPALEKHGFANEDLIVNWAHFVGQDFADFSRPQKIFWPMGRDEKKSNSSQYSHMPGTLHIAVAASHALNMQFDVDIIQDRINSFFHYKLIGKIKLLNTPVSEFHVDEQLSDQAALNSETLSETPIPVKQNETVSGIRNLDQALDDFKKAYKDVS